jgi:hypothetical protein
MISVIASDGKGGTTQAFTLTVKAPVVNTAPVAKADSVTLDEDTTVKINVLANDSDAEGDMLTATLVTGPQHGTLVKNADGSFSYTPTRDWYGTSGRVQRNQRTPAVAYQSGLVDLGHVQQRNDKRGGFLH